MANWMQIPGGLVVNADNVQSAEVQNRVLILRMVDGRQVSKAYDSSADAYSAKATVEASLLNPTSGSPVIASISPNSVPVNGDSDLTVTGTNFQTTAIITIGSSVYHNCFVSSTTLFMTWTGFSDVPGVYNVVYTDGAGGTNTLVAGFTIT